MLSSTCPTLGARTLFLLFRSANAGRATSLSVLAALAHLKVLHPSLEIHGVEVFGHLLLFGLLLFFCHLYRVCFLQHLEPLLEGMFILLVVVPLDEVDELEALLRILLKGHFQQVLGVFGDCHFRRVVYGLILNLLNHVIFTL